MKKNILVFMLFLIFVGICDLFAKQYELPPTATTSSSVPVISDEAMEACVILYNEAEWLLKDINTMRVDNYSQSSVNNYNGKVNKHSNMTKKFNINCAGKQSESAYKATQKLNNQRQ